MQKKGEERRRREEERKKKEKKKKKRRGGKRGKNVGEIRETEILSIWFHFLSRQRNLRPGPLFSLINKCVLKL